MIEPSEDFLKKMDSKNKCGEKDRLLKDIRTIETYRNLYTNDTNIFKGFKAIGFLYRLNSYSNKIALSELYIIAIRTIVPTMLFIFAFFINDKFIEYGYNTGVNSYIFLLFISFSLYSIISNTNKKAASVLEKTQLMLREIKLKNINSN